MDRIGPSSSALCTREPWDYRAPGGGNPSCVAEIPGGVVFEHLRQRMVSYIARTRPDFLS